MNIKLNSLFVYVFYMHVCTQVENRMTSEYCRKLNLENLHLVFKLSPPEIVQEGLKWTIIVFHGKLVVKQGME